MSDRLPNKKLKTLETPLSNVYTEFDSQDNDIESAIFQLEMLHIELDKLNDKENEEILVIDQKYKKLRQHYYNKRSEVIDAIPDFWSTVFTSHPAICQVLYDDDEDTLRHLKKLEVETFDNIKSGYSIRFLFNENPYFKNDLLVKEFQFKQGALTSTSTKIEWKKPYPSLSSTSKDSPSKNSRKKGNGSNSFFAWFVNNEDASNDFVAEVIKDDIWANSLHYYLVPDPDMEGNIDKGDSSDSTSSEYDEDEMFDFSTEKIHRNLGEGSSSTK